MFPLLDCDIFDWTVAFYLSCILRLFIPPSINNPISLQYPFPDFVFQRLICRLWHWTYLLETWTPHLWSERVGQNKVSQRSFLGLKLQAIQMIQYFAKKLITMLAPATTSSTWHEIRLFKNTVLVCSYSVWHHFPVGPSNDASPEASYMKMHRVNLLISVHLETANVDFRWIELISVYWGNGSMSW